jgi:hypothetical protein
MTSTRCGPLRGAHVDDAVVDEEVLALDQLDAHLLGEEGVLEVGAVERAGREQHHRRDRRTPAGATLRSVSSSRSG